MKRKNLKRRAISILVICCMMLTMFPFLQVSIVNDNGNVYAAISANPQKIAIDWAVKIARDDTHGYSMGSWGPDYDCATLIVSAYRKAGFSFKNYSFNAKTDFAKEGFRFISASALGMTSSNKVPAKLKPGDVLVSNSHVEMYIGDGENVGAHDNFDRRRGDSNGREINVSPYSYNYWIGVMRYDSCNTHTCTKSASQKAGVCDKCGAPYTEWDTSQETWDTTCKSTAKRYYRTSQKVQLRVYPKSTSNVVKTIDTNYGVKVLAKKGSWYKVIEQTKKVGYVPVSSLTGAQSVGAKTTSTLSVSLDQSCLTAMTKGKDRYITGKVSSNYPLKSVQIIAQKGDVVKKSEEETFKGREYILKNISPGSGWGFVKDFNLGKRGSGAWTIKLVATDCSGKSVTGTGTIVISDSGVKKPAITTENIDTGGKRIVFTNTEGGTMYIKAGGHSYTTTSSVRKINMTTAATWNAEAYVWTGPDGSKKRSATATKPVTVKQCKPPIIQIDQEGEGGKLTILKRDNDDIIEYSTNDGTTYTKYTKPVSINNGVTVLARAYSAGNLKSEVEEDKADFSEPGEPEAKLLNTGDTIAVGDTATVSWPANKAASSYEALLYKEGASTTADRVETSGTTASFKITEAGSYYIEVTALNGSGRSAASSRVEFRAVDALTVTFRDDSTIDENGTETEGTTLAAVKVKYGESPEKVQEPSRKGYIFSGWMNENGTLVSPNGYLTDKIREDTVYVAKYRQKTYRVRYYAPDEELVTTEEIAYGEDAQTDEVIAEFESSGYITDTETLAGWKVLKTYGQESIADVHSVDADMDIQAVINLENPDLPVSIEFVGDDPVTVTPMSGKTVFSPTLKLTSKVNKDLSLYLIASLKGTDQETGVEKTLYTDRRVFAISGEERVLMLDGGAHGFDLEVSDAAAANAATKLEIVAVERKEGGRTGSTYSNLAAYEGITQESSWTEPTAWSDEKPAAAANRLIEEKTQYSYRDQKVAYSGGETPAGFNNATKTKETVSTTYGNWYASSTKPTGSTSTTNAYETVVSYESVASHRWYAYYCDCGKVCWKTKSGTCKYCGGKTDNSLIVYTTTGYNGKTGNVNSDGDYSFPKTITRSASGNIRAIYYNSKQTESFTTKAVTGEIYLWKSSDFSRTIYRSKTVKSRYKFTKWDDDWSPYSDTVYTASSTRQVRTKTQYRYSDLVDAPPAVTHMEGTPVVIEGNLKDIEEDLDGRKATIMVYQTLNDDPNQYQMQYTGQITIRTDETDESIGRNYYKFEFIPKDKPNAKTGNFIVSLGIEGTTGLVTVGAVEADKPIHKVTLYYMNGDEKVYLTDEPLEVPEGENADIESIELPELSGRYFIGWSQKTTNITSDCEIEAVYVTQPSVAVFVDWVQETIDIQHVQGSVEMPSAPEETKGYTFAGWKLADGTIAEPGDEVPVTGDMLIEAVYTETKYTVRFLKTNGSVVSTQQVGYQSSAEPPEYEPAEGIFVGWSMDVTWWKVEEDIDVYPIIVYDEQALKPTARVITSYADEDDADGTKMLELSIEDDEEENTDIYYTTDGTIPTANLVAEYLNTDNGSYSGSISKYEEPLSFAEDTYVMAIGYTEGKNESDICAVYISNDPEEDTDYVVGEEASGAWQEIGTYEVRAKASNDVTVSVDISDNPGLTGYDFLIESDKGTFYADSNQYGEPDVTGGNASENGTLLTMEQPEGWRINWNSIEANSQNGRLFTLTLHVDEEAETSTVPVSVYYAPGNTYDEDSNEIELENVSVTIESEACTDIATKDIVLSRTSFIYEGTAMEPVVSIEGLREGEDYSVEYVDNVEVGTAKAVITGMRDYTGSVEKEFTITQANIANAEIEAVPDQTVTGEVIEPELSISYNGKALVRDTDYSVAYANNTEVGTATATVSGKGNFKGTTTAEFQIIETLESRLEAALRAKEEAEASLADAIQDKEDAETERDEALAQLSDLQDSLREKEAELTQAQADLVAAQQTVTDLETQLAASAGENAQLQTQLDDAVAARDEASARVDELTQDKETLEEQLEAANKAKEDAEVQLEAANKAKEAAEKRAEAAEKALEEAQNQSGDNSGSNSGSTDGNANSGSQAQPANPAVAQPAEIVDLPAVRIAKPKAAKKAATVKWKKVSKKNQKKIGNIQIQYSMDKTFTNDVKTVNAKKSAKSRKVKGMASKKTYYVRVRAYKNVGGVAHVSNWSKVKKVKAK